jgi:hypothetical protein
MLVALTHPETSEIMVFSRLMVFHLALTEESLMNAYKFFGQFVGYRVLAVALTLALTLAFGLAACKAPAGIIVAGTEQAHLDFANDPMFQSVGWIRGVDNTGGYLAGSGVLISPQWVLTAAHVLDNGWNSVSFSMDAYAGDPNRTLYPADAWYLHPNFVDDNGLGTTDDIALIHLSVPIVGVVPAGIYQGAVPVGTHAYWSGYGRLGYYPSGEVPPSGTKRGGENAVDSIGSVILGIQEQFFLADWGPALHTPTLPLEMGGTNGDSGGGWFADMGHGMALIGLTTFGRGNFYDTGAIRPALYTNWISQYVVSVPEPSSLMLMFCTFPFIARRAIVAMRKVG